MTDLMDVEALTHGLLNNKDSPMIVTLEETVTRPILLFAAHVIIPPTLNFVLGMISVSFSIINLSEDVICFPCLSQEMDGSGTNDAGQLISKRAPRSKVTRVPIWMEIGCRFKVRLSLIHISEPTRPLYISYAVFCLKKKAAGNNAQAGKLVAVRTRGPKGKSGPLERAQLANQIQEFRTAQMLE